MSIRLAPIIKHLISEIQFFRIKSFIAEPDNRQANGYPVLLSQLTFEAGFAIMG